MPQNGRNDAKTSSILLMQLDNNIMGISVEFSKPKDATPGKGSAGLQSQMGGFCTTVSAIMEASKAIENESLVKKSIG